MLHRLTYPGTASVVIVLISTAWLIYHYKDEKREEYVAANINTIKTLLYNTRDIHEAKSILESNGYRIVSGPEFSVYDKSYYSMVVDFGIRPNRVERLMSMFGFEAATEKYYGSVKARVSGEIFSIE